VSQTRHSLRAIKPWCSKADQFHACPLASHCFFPLKYKTFCCFSGALELGGGLCKLYVHQQ